MKEFHIGVHILIGFMTLTLLSSNIPDFFYPVLSASAGEMRETSNPIIILGNEDLGRTASDMGWSGSGQHYDPYVISGLYIDGLSGSSGLYIEDVSLYLEIENCVINNKAMEGQSCGILINRCSNFTISNTHAIGSIDAGLKVIGSKLITISHCELNGNGFGIKISDSKNLDINSNHVHHNNVGFQVFRTEFINLVGNSIFDNSRDGLRLLSSTCCEVYGNMFLQNGGYGVFSNNTYGSRIFSNSFLHNCGTSEEYQSGKSQAKDIYGTSFGSNQWYDEKMNRGNHWRDFIYQIYRENNSSYPVAGGFSSDPYPLEKSPIRSNPSTPITPSVRYLGDDVILYWEPPIDDGFGNEDDTLFYSIGGVCRGVEGISKTYPDTYRNQMQLDDLDWNKTYDFYVWSNNKNYRSLASLDIPVTFDKEAPRLTVDYQDDRIYTNRSDLKIIWNAWDRLSGISHMELKIGTAGWENIGDVRECDIHLEENGISTLYLRACDREGNSKKLQLFIVKDTKKPLMDLVWNMNSTYLNVSDMTVGMEAEDPVSGIDICKMRVDSEGWISSEEGFDHTFRDLTNGEHTLTIEARDKAGNVITKTMNFTIDEEDPFVEILNPKEGGTYLSTGFEFKWVHYEKVSGIDEMDYRLDDGPWKSSYMEEDLLMEDISDGSHRFQVRVSDMAGNRDICGVNFIVNTEEPEVVEYFPKNRPMYVEERAWVIFSEEMDPERTTIEIEGVGGNGVWENGRLFFDPLNRLEKNRIYHVKVNGYDLGKTKMSSFEFDVLTTSGEWGNCDVKGTAVDQHGNPLCGVNVMVDGALMALTDENGSFHLKTEQGEHTVVLKYSHGDRIVRRITAREYRTVEMEDFVFPGLENESAPPDDGGISWSLFAITVLIALILGATISLSIVLWKRKSEHFVVYPDGDDIESDYKPDRSPLDYFDPDVVNSVGVTQDKNPIPPTTQGQWVNDQADGWVHSIPIEDENVPPPNVWSEGDMYSIPEEDEGVRPPTAWPVNHTESAEEEMEYRGLDLSVLEELDDLVEEQEDEGEFSWRDLANPLYGMDTDELNNLTDINCYEILGIRPDADWKEIRRSYRELARKYHPDHISYLDLTLKKIADVHMRIVNYARDTLTDPQARLEHDRRHGII